MNQRRIGTVAGLKYIAASLVIAFSTDEISHECRMVEEFGGSLKAGRELNVFKGRGDCPGVACNCSARVWVKRFQLTRPTA